jgi:DNA (cytosine-5)-methyltransferase 1
VIHYPFLNLTEYRRFLVKFLSICSGIEAASVAWEPLGWEAVAFSEIEPFPSAVLAHHYPSVPNLGDMTKFDTWPEEIFLEADLIVGGPPCQAFSVAGNRGGLADGRGNLTLVYVQLINHADLIRKKHGKEPVIAFYENVPGLFSDKTNAFGCLLGALAGEDGALLAPGGKWTDAGCVSGPQRTMAWRLLDAQYFGLAQRRRRVFLVASARDGFNPAEILFEREGVRRDFAPSRETGQETPTNFVPSVAHCLETTSHDYSRADGFNMITEPVYAIQGSMIGRNDHAGPQGNGINADVCFTQNTTDRHAVVYEAQPFTETADCLTAAYGTKWNGNASATNGSLFVAQAIPIHDQATRFAGKRGDKQDGKGNGLGIGEPGAPMNTLTKGDRHAVAHAMVFDTTNITSPQNGSNPKPGDPCFTLAKGQHPPLLTHAIPLDLRNAGRDPEKYDAINRQGVGVGEEGDPAHTITSAFVHGVAHPTVLMDQGGSVMSVMEDGTVGTLRRETHGHEPVIMAPTLTASNDPSRSPQSTEVTNQVASVYAASMAVRRLTPVECERLQGFPDDYTNIPWRKQPTSPDGPRYKALGNSWAVPNVRWIGARIDNYLKGEVK